MNIFSKTLDYTHLKSRCLKHGNVCVMSGCLPIVNELAKLVCKLLNDNIHQRSISNGKLADQAILILNRRTSVFIIKSLLNQA